MIKPQRESNLLYISTTLTTGFSTCSCHDHTNALVKVKIHGGSAGAGGSHVLLDIGLSPATEVLPVRVGRVVVVVRVPQWEVTKLGGATSDGVPLGCRSVHTERHTAFLSLVHHGVDEIDIRGLVTRPILREAKQKIMIIILVGSFFITNSQT